jgi:hypothetical protein
MIEATPIILSALGCLSNCSGCHPDDLAPLYSLHRDISELLNREQVEPAFPSGLPSLPDGLGCKAYPNRGDVTSRKLLIGTTIL